MPWKEPTPTNDPWESPFTARVTKEVWKRVVLWVIIALLSGYIFATKSDYDYMVRENALMKKEFIEDVVGYNYCDRD